MTMSSSLGPSCIAFEAGYVAAVLAAFAWIVYVVDVDDPVVHRLHSQRNQVLIVKRVRVHGFRNPFVDE